MRNKAEQYRSRARLCLEIARTLSPGKKVMDRATLIDLAQTWLRLAQEEEQEAAKGPMWLDDLGSSSSNSKFRLTRKTRPPAQRP